MTLRIAALVLMVFCTAERPRGQQPSRPVFPDAYRAFKGLFTPANRTCPGCEQAIGTAHFVIDSERLTAEFLGKHTHRSNGGAFGDNEVVADFWYDAVHRRLFTRSLVLQEVDDPADLRLGRAPGTFPNDPDFTALLSEGVTVGHVGFERWTHNGFGSYFAAVQGAVRDTETGYLDLSTVTGQYGRTRTGSAYEPEDLIKHVRLHPSGLFEVGYETSPEARPDASLVVHGHTRLEGDLIVDGTVQGGGVLRACSTHSSVGRRGRVSAASCGEGQLAIAGGGACASGELRASHPTQAGDAPDGWEVACSRDGTHTAYVICCAR